MSARAVLTRLGRRIAARIEAYQGSPGRCCTCGEGESAYEYRDACSNGGYWDWVQCEGCHSGSDEHAVWMRTLTHRRYEEATR